MALETYLSYLAVVAVFFAHPPGPSQILFMSHSLRGGVRPAFPTMAGDLSANAVQIVAAGAGLVGLIHASSGAIEVIKWLGVAYLVWLGARSLFARHEPHAVAPPAAQRFRQGFLTSAANPYAVVFFAALFPQFIDPDLALWPQIAILGVTYLIIDAAILLVFGLSAARIFQWAGSRAAAWVNRVSGLMMIAAAFLLSQSQLAPEPDA